MLCTLRSGTSSSRSATNVYLQFASSFLAASSSRTTTMRVVFHTSAHASPPSICMTAAARRRRVCAPPGVCAADAEITARQLGGMSLPLPYVIFRPWRRFSPSCSWPVAPPLSTAPAGRGRRRVQRRRHAGVGLELLGGALVRGAEAWHTAGDDDDDGGDGELSDAVEREYCLTNSVLTATTPLALLSRRWPGAAVDAPSSGPLACAGGGGAARGGDDRRERVVARRAAGDGARADDAALPAMVAMPAGPTRRGGGLVASGTIAPVAAGCSLRRDGGGRPRLRRCCGRPRGRGARTRGGGI